MICIRVDMSVGSRCEEGNNRREEMTRKEKRCGEEGDVLMDLMDGMYLMYEPHPSPPRGREGCGAALAHPRAASPS